ncbi:M3 family oligoendopeptidase [Bacillus daqingensis]|uniref:M3 family oligoendopeptidase n=1 Tax=Bacillus daqingensis TaxID=872396 RepID=A0ABV9NU83_9BACI
MKKALVAGATGLVGRQLTEKLLEQNAYDNVRLLTRRRTPFHDHENVTEHVVDFDALEQYAEAFEGVDDVFIALGSTIKKAGSRENFMQVDYLYPLKIAELANKHNCGRVLAVSAMGADRESRFFYNQVKGSMEEALMALELPTLHIIRPSLLTGERYEFRLGEKSAEMLTKPVKGWLKGPLQKLAPIEASVVAEAMALIAQSESRGLHVFENEDLHRIGTAVRGGGSSKEGRYRQTWNLDSIFKGGSSSKQFAQFLTNTETDLSTMKLKLEKAAAKDAPDPEEWAYAIERLQTVGMKVREVNAFVSCLTAQDVHDKEARRLGGKTKELASLYRQLFSIVDEQLLQFTDAQWHTFMEQETMQKIAENLQERRDLAKEKLPSEQEQLIQKLSTDGYHAWGELYNTIVGRMKVDIREKGIKRSYSVGQAANKMSDKNRAVRRHVFRQFEQAWEKEAELFTSSLNHLAGFRLASYEARGWENVLKEPLMINRMKQETLDTMWETIEHNKSLFTGYLNRKAELLGVEKLAIYDVSAPLTKEVPQVSFDDAADMIIEQFGRFSPEMAAFAEKAFKEEWIEAENRDGKRPGGFCTSFPIREQSRIFMTYDGSASNVATLAHELGHAYHQHVMNDMPYMAQGYAMNVAETASTFAEMIVADASVKQASSRKEKLQLLDDKLNRSVAFFMNIHSRFLFETRFYEERKNGLVSQERLNELMTEAQKEAYQDSLSEYSPMFWASKLHFHITGVPFYNFPYTFGYLFSMGIYARAAKEGTSFQAKYTELLRDTGRLDVETLAHKHLGEDITKPDFWQKAIDFLKEDVETFMKLSEEELSSKK